MNESRLWAFIEESNMIEGIFRAPHRKEFDISKWFLDLEKIETKDLEAVVSVFAPGHLLRNQEGLDVQVGNYVAPRGGPNIQPHLEYILTIWQGRGAFWIHKEYESLHPFTDGNGRSGRLLWLWMMKKRAELERALSLGFLHAWYYQTLEHSDAR